MQKKTLALIATTLAYACSSSSPDPGNPHGGSGGPPGLTGGSLTSGGAPGSGGNAGAGLAGATGGAFGKGGTTGGAGTPDSGAGGSRADAGSAGQTAGAATEGGSSPGAGGAPSQTGGSSQGGDDSSIGGDDPGLGGGGFGAGAGGSTQGGSGPLECGLLPTCAIEGEGGAGAGGAGETDTSAPSAGTGGAAEFAAAAPSGTVLDFGRDGDWKLTAINNHGQIIGLGPCGAFLYENDSIRNLLDAGGRGMDSVVDINDAGVVIGYVGEVPVLWQDGMTWRPENLEGQMLAINNQDQILVWDRPRRLGYIWKAGTRTEIRGAAAARLDPTVINNLGQVGGSIDGSVGFVWEEGNVTAIPDFNQVYALNDSGQMLGIARNGGYGFWDGQQMVDLDQAAGLRRGTLYPQALGPTGSVVGSSNSDGPFIYSHGTFSLLRATVDGRRARYGGAVDVNANNAVIGISGTITFGPGPWWWDNYTVNQHALAWNVSSNACNP
jgi:hypothetical protein